MCTLVMTCNVLYDATILVLQVLLKKQSQPEQKQDMLLKVGWKIIFVHGTFLKFIQAC